MDKKYKIRLIKVEEVKKLRELIVALQVYQDMKNIPRLPTIRELESELVCKVDGKQHPIKCGTFTLVAVDKSRIGEKNQAHVVGYLIYSHSFSIKKGPHFYMNSFFIEEDYRRRGLGKKFIEYIRLHAISTGIGELDVPVMNSNLIGQKFYESFGAYFVNEEYMLMDQKLENKLM